MKSLGILTAAVGALALTTGIALAADQYDAAGGAGQITVTAKGGWHVNRDYPWKVTAGDKTFDKSKFTLDEHSAKVTGVPAGKAHVKGAVCIAGDHPSCMPFETDVIVK